MLNELSGRNLDELDIYLPPMPKRKEGYKLTGHKIKVKALRLGIPNHIKPGHVEAYVEGAGIEKRFIITDNYSNYRPNYYCLIYP
jgi:hypothetical protein